MPREMVRACTDPYHVKVGWMKDGADVQLGVEGDEGRSLLWLLYGGDALADTGAVLRAALDDIDSATTDSVLAGKVLDTLDAASELGERGYQGVWARLDRHGINRLIRLLRQARDDAFGRDE